VSLATVCDVMPLRKINKIIISNTINKFNLKDNLAINTIFDQLKIKKKISIDDLGFLIGPIINSGGRLNYSNYGTELLSSEDHKIIKDRSYKLIKLNNKRKKIEQNLFDEIDFKQIYKKNEDVIIYYKNNLNEGLIGIIASRLKEYFNKPVIVITTSNNILKASARSNQYYNIGYVVKSLIDNNIIDNGGGHSMAAGFTMKKDKLIKLKDFIFKDYLSKNKSSTFTFKYDSEILPTAINNEFNNEISKLSPFGNDNACPLFLIKDLKIIKVNVIEKKHINVILKPKIGRSIKSISFNSFNTQIGDILISYKKHIHVIAQIHENNWNNKRDLQLNIRDILISIN
jgi:single-stranded-DNA-specific exonuclease